jgi:ribonuclease VapC
MSAALFQPSTLLRPLACCVASSVKSPSWNFWQWLTDNRIEIVPFDAVQAYEAAAAYDRCGKGLHPRARLNLADCAAYALAKTMKAPLLFKGDDFAATDVLAWGAA